ncbi:MAG: hypothetical protein KKI08_24745 [Armatimonadetes bacterium]|nr:hypothetical protein [Armatimonadota bacterium]
MEEDRQTPPAAGAQPSPPSPRSRGERLLDLVVAVALAAIVLHRLSLSVVDVDLWHEMALAREIVTTGAVPVHDSFAYTPTLPVVVHHEWGAGMIATVATRLGGAAGLLLLRYALTAALCWVCWLCARRRGATMALLRFMAMVAVLLADVGFGTVRAQQYSFVFAALLLLWLDRDRAGDRRWLWLWLPLFVLWANLHAGVAFGVGLFAAHVGEQLLRRRRVGHLLGAGAAMAALLVVNPWGLHYYSYLWRATTMARPLVTEWAPLLQAADPLRLALFVASLLVAGWTVWRVGFRRFEGLAILLLTALAAFKSYRLVCFYALAWFCYVPGYLQEELRQRKAGRAFLDNYSPRDRMQFVVWGAVAALFLVLGMGQQPWRARVPGRPLANEWLPVYPVGAVDYLQARGFRGNVATCFEGAAYVSWRLYPAVRVSFDSRYEVAYPPGSLERNQALYAAGPGWERLLTADGTQAVLVQRNQPLAQALPHRGGWRRAYRDEVFEVWVPAAATQLPPGEAVGQARDGTVPGPGVSACLPGRRERPPGGPSASDEPAARRASRPNSDKPPLC